MLIPTIEIEISGCNDCPFWDAAFDMCRLTDENILGPDIIPDWCPLQEADAIVSLSKSKWILTKSISRKCGAQ